MGKVALLMVVSFGIALGIILPNSYRNANFAYDNYIAYLEDTHAHNIAVSAVNMAADTLFWNKTWRTGFTNVNYAGGKFSVTVKDTNTTWVKLTAVGTFQDSTEMVQIILQPGNFAQFGYYSNIEGSIYWITGDTVWGRMHSQSTLNISGSPVFMGKVTTKSGTNPKKSSAKFLGGYQSGVDIPLPADLSSVTAAATSGGKVYSAGDLWITLKGDSVLWKTSATGTVTRTTISAYAPNGVINVSNGNLYLQGTFSGRATICATGTSPKGNVYIEDNVLYQNNPTSDPTVTNMLGIVAQNNIIVSDNVANGTDCEIDAALFCLNGGMTAQNYNRSTGTSPPVLRGRLTLLGGITQYQRGAVGTSSGGTIATGYLKNYKYDERLGISFPPFFPLTGKYQIISWLE
jgi:hypothetical protein